jgi:hemoglobin
VNPTDPHPSELHPHEVHDLVGGMPAFERLVDAFYDRVEDDELLRPLYPDDLEPGKRHLALFLAQYWGGGEVYGDERGHPRLRMRHAQFPITPEHAMRWAELMTAAVREQGWPEAAEALLLAYVSRATPTLINRIPDELQAPPGRSLPGT